MSWIVHHNKEPFDVFVARPSKWSNPFSSKEHASATFKTKSRADSLYQYSLWLLSQPELMEEAKKELKGKILGCWCYPKKRCHGELLAAIANDLPLPDYAPQSKEQDPPRQTLF